MKVIRKLAFCMAAVMLGGSFALPAAAADDVAGQIKAASGEMYSVNTKDMKFKALSTGYSSLLSEEDNEKQADIEWNAWHDVTSKISASDNYVFIADNVRALSAADRGMLLAFDKNGNEYLRIELGALDSFILYNNIISANSGLYSKQEDNGWDEIKNEPRYGIKNKNAVYIELSEKKQFDYTCGTAMVNNVAAVFEDISDPNAEPDEETAFEGGGTHQLSLINEKGEKILTLSEPIELIANSGGGRFVYYNGYNYSMDFGYYAEDLLPFYCDRKLGDTLNDLMLNTGADKDGETDAGDGFFRQMKSNKYIFAEHEAGYADLTGKIVIPQKFDEVSSFCEGFAWVGILDSEANQKKYGFIDKSGEYVIEPQLENVGSFSEGLAPVKKDGKWGYIDKSGKFVIEPKYDEWYGGLYGNTLEIGAGSFSNGIAKVGVKDGDEPAKWGYINSKGETILPLEYDDAFGSDGTYFTVGKTVDGAVKYGVVDQDGNTVLPFIFEDMTAPVDGVAYAFYNRELYSFIISKANLESGDLDGDGEIGAEDAQNVLTLYAESVAGNEPRLTDAQKKAADVNGDGTIDVADAQLILLYYVQNTVTGIPTDWKDLIS